MKQAYEAINTEGFQAVRGRISRIGDYLCAANALYAVTPVSLVLEIFNKYEAKKLNGRGTDRRVQDTVCSPSRGGTDRRPVRGLCAGRAEVV